MTPQVLNHLSKPVVKTHNLNVLITDEEYQHLRALKRACNQSMGNIVRNTIASAYLTIIARQPHCADGAVCVSQGMKIQSMPPPPPTQPELHNQP